MKRAFSALALVIATIMSAPVIAQETLVPAEPGTLAWHNAQQAALHSRTAAQGWSTLEGGVKFRRVAGDGTGPAPTVEDIVTVNYTGSFPDGQVFDSNEGGDPVEFPLGRLVPGWQIAIPYMGVGDTAEIAVPMDLAYGPEGRGPIPGGATLLFTIELLGVARP
ncbi:FKBP-type peptidyl-prolyl cis-trans isomerase [Aurantiacibacter spongiae]|uniref:Peptidyl-prolyl cis-trans isomerase n=1 Tax=Aurantiacibacter spongiae TaxID=2488860 RepID=A0A3N5DKS5_9SPHN|nr:FKBP-type peptidyl-prolyl cis-trans isomerase [Aurantiacibacter spongiae]RPF72312.1 FKBP-type peptidyl-prolyl cis-trans isomerase [Aurantiacibacter spongiae]